MTDYAKPADSPVWGETNTTAADMIRPTDDEIKTGWPLSNLPPPRQRFNWLINWLFQAVRYLFQMGISEWSATESYRAGSRVIGDDGKTYKSLQAANTNHTPSTSPAWWEVWALSTSEIPGSLGASIAGGIGFIRNGYMHLSTASYSANYTADEVVVGTALGGRSYGIGSVNLNVNLSTTGAGGMDTGAPPNSGFVGIYLIYNPTTGAKALMAVNATAAVVPEVYGGGNMPTGYTASCLVSIRPTNSSGQIAAGGQRDRKVRFPSIIVLSTTTPAGTRTALSVSTAAPRNTKSVCGSVTASNSSSASQDTSLELTSDTLGSNGFTVELALTSVSGSGATAPFSDLQVFTAQTIYYKALTTTGTPAYSANITGYDF